MTKKRTPSIFRALVLLTGLILAAGQSFADNQPEHAFTLGYRTIDLNGARLATPYQDAESSLLASVKVGYAAEWGHLNFDADYRGEEEHTGEFHIEFGPYLSLELHHHQFIHYTEHIPYDSAVQGGRTGVAGEFDYSDTATGENELVVTEHSAKTRVRFGTYPAHLKLSARQFKREGDIQHRWVDESCSTSSCHFKSTNQKVDEEINEIIVSADAHLGTGDLIISHEYREFREKGATDTFQEHFPRPAGEYEHDVAPKSRYMASTIMGHSSLSGGVVAAGSATLGIRENRGSIDDITGIDAKTEFVKTAGDLTWIPNEKLAITLRHRYLQMNSTNSDSLALAAYNTTLTPKEAMDLQRNALLTTLSYRPTRHLTLKAETEFRQIFRGSTLEEAGIEPGDLLSSSVGWNLPEEENVSRVKLGFFARPLGDSTFKIRGWTQHQRSDDPAYGTSANMISTGFLGFDWLPGRNWGASLNSKIDYNINKDHAFFARDDSGVAIPVSRDREGSNQSYALLIWANPTPTIATGLHLGFLKSSIDQGVLFGNDQYNSTASENFSIASAADYDQEVQTVSAYLNWTLTDKLLARWSGHYIISTARFAPEFADRALNYDGSTLAATAAGLSDFGRVDLKQTGMSLGFDYDLSNNWRSGLVLAYDHYDDRVSNVYDSNVKSVSVNLATSW